MFEEADKATSRQDEVKNRKDELEAMLGALGFSSVDEAREKLVVVEKKEEKVEEVVEQKVEEKVEEKIEEKVEEKNEEQNQEENNAGEAGGENQGE